MRELEKVLNTGEKVLWEGKPQFLPYFANTIWGTGILILFGLVFLWLINLPCVPPNCQQYIAPGLTIGHVSLISSFPLVIGVLIFIYGLINYSFIHYALTDRRVIMQTGIIGRDFKFVDYDQIANAEVRVGLWDKLFSKDAGTVMIATAGAPISYSRDTRHGGRSVTWPYMLMHVPDAYGVFRILKEVGYAVKTDIQYPNLYRPQVNPGYRTEYKSGEGHHPHDQPPPPPQQQSRQ